MSGRTQEVNLIAFVTSISTNVTGSDAVDTTRDNVSIA